MSKPHERALAASRHGCLAFLPTGGQGSSDHCRDEPVYAGRVSFPDGEIWLAFACEGHEHLMTNPHAMTEEERAELETRRRHSADALTWKPWIPPKPIRPKRRR